MLIKEEVTSVQAIYDYVIIDIGDPLKPGDEEKTDGGLVIGRSVGEVSQWGKVVSIGSDVLHTKVGDVVVLPLGTGGSLIYVPSVIDVSEGKNNVKSDKHVKLVATQERLIRGIYRK